jgi:hypothetical protein
MEENRRTRKKAERGCRGRDGGGEGKVSKSNGSRGGERRKRKDK